VFVVEDASAQVDPVQKPGVQARMDETLARVEGLQRPAALQEGRFVRMPAGRPPGGGLRSGGVRR